MLPGDYIAFKLTGEATTTDTGLSEGIGLQRREGSRFVVGLLWYKR